MYLNTLLSNSSSFFFFFYLGKFTCTLMGGRSIWAIKSLTVVACIHGFLVIVLSHRAMLYFFSAFKAGPIAHELQVRYQTCRDTLWSMWSIVTVSIFFSWKVWLKLNIDSCRLTSGIQFGQADKSLQMHPLFSQWHVKKDLNTEYSIMWERPLDYWLSFLSTIFVRIVRVRQRCARRPCDAGKTWDGPPLWSVKAGKN